MEERALKTIEWLEQRIKQIKLDHPDDDFDLYDEVEIALEQELYCYTKVLGMLKGP